MGPCVSSARHKHLSDQDDELDIALGEHENDAANNESDECSRPARCRVEQPKREDGCDDRQGDRRMSAVSDDEAENWELLHELSVTLGIELLK
jgi:hypothetical protein